MPKSKKGVKLSPRAYNGNGKPTKEILDAVEKAAEAQATDHDIGMMLGVSESTMKRHCAKALKAGRSKGRANIAQKIYEQAMSGEKTLLKFWAEQHLGWKTDPATIRAQAQDADGKVTKIEVELVKL